MIYSKDQQDVAVFITFGININLARYCPAKVDSLMENSVTTSEVMRSIQMGLVCVQEHPDDRPTMPSVLLMLDSEQPSVPQPKQSGSYTERFLTESISSSTNEMPQQQVK
ncbi:receptor-like serine/threonine-protein kinase SD1-8 [Durio zibethinus]|uniref:Receptor-like serine/threonine-protein kinase SD1-8 n=1 Tax=Durio zibethinus TaxID=66656 RepID=A0A6P5WEX4_DURZI|nr:receptor-like serine/threonine-protein kinase SD1-8 [Durio zibethinus]